jgi:hypothetical protein
MHHRETHAYSSSTHTSGLKNAAEFLPEGDKKEGRQPAAFRMTGATP